MLETELIVAALNEVDRAALADAELTGRVQLGLEPDHRQVALYVRADRDGRRRVGLVNSREVLSHLQQGKQGFARLDQCASGPPMIVCTLIH